MRKQTLLVVVASSLVALLVTSGLVIGAAVELPGDGARKVYDSLRLTPTRTPTAAPRPGISTHQTVALRSLSPPNTLQGLSYISGGAGSFVSYAQRRCTEFSEGQVSVYISGVYSTGDNPCWRELEQFGWCPFWGNLYDQCKDNIFLADMVNFLARGYGNGEIVEFSMKDPLGGIEHYSTTVDRLERLHPSGRIEEEYEAARLSWVASPTLGPGEYELTVSGASGTATLTFNVYESPMPNFGASFGAAGHPLVLTHNEEIQLYYAGFLPGQTVQTFLYRSTFPAISDFGGEEYVQYWLSATHSSDVSTTGENDLELVGGFEIRVNENGYAEVGMIWPDSLAQGLYSLVVPEVIPEGTVVPHPFFTIPFLVALPQVEIAASAANLRSGPGLGFEVVGWGQGGERYPAIGRAYGDDRVWYKIRLPDRTAAWISERIVEVVPSADSIPWVDEYSW
jgi:hypothetical protein